MKWKYSLARTGPTATARRRLRRTLSAAHTQRRPTCRGQVLYDSCRPLTRHPSFVGSISPTPAVYVPNKSCSNLSHHAGPHSPSVIPSRAVECPVRPLHIVAVDFPRDKPPRTQILRALYPTRRHTSVCSVRGSYASKFRTLSSNGCHRHVIRCFVLLSITPRDHRHLCGNNNMPRSFLQ